VVLLLLLVPLLGLGSTTAVSDELAAVRVTKRREMEVLLRLGTWQAALRHVLAGKLYVVSMLLAGARGVQSVLGLAERTDGLEDKVDQAKEELRSFTKKLGGSCGVDVIG